MNSREPAIRCGEQLAFEQLDGWVIDTYAGAGGADPTLLAHLLRCPACRRRAAMGWVLLPDSAAVSEAAVPPPDLSFLQPVRGLS